MQQIAVNGVCVANATPAIIVTPSNNVTVLVESQQEPILSISSLGFLLFSIALSVLLTVASKFISKLSDSSLDILHALLTQTEAINRGLLLANLWSSVALWSFCVTGMNMLANCVLSMYFATIVMEPVCRQIKAVPSSSRLFQSMIALSQFTGINTLRILTS